MVAKWTRDYKTISKFFRMNKKEEYTLGDQTWEDIDMNSVYEKLDRTYSSLGEEVLYSILRNPIMKEEELIRRNKLIRVFKSNEKLREELQCIFLNLSKNQINTFLDMIEKEITINKFKYYLYIFLGKGLPCIIIIICIFVDIKYLIVLMPLSFVDMFVNSRERLEIKSNGVLYLRKIIKAAKKIKNIKDESIKDYTDKIAAILKEIKAIDIGTKFVGFANMWGGVFEALSVVFLIEECAYYAISNSMSEKKEKLVELYYTMAYRENTNFGRNIKVSKQI